MCPMHLYSNIHSANITSCECERSVSALSLVKTKLRATIGQDRLSSLCLLSIHRDVKIDIAKVVALFAKKNPGRMALPSVLLDSV
ncbi:hypothetical protein MAR_009250 [Mya arenaria]|uniref:HAT C-terminal dimerisation domain-containing protein n=1 Tax=Mya arenaria TaxID=6604 RepID=A0ABY7DY81_MYAAR|nr:hypothetical protein MAR_009250 [Mya arenaria]